MTQEKPRFTAHGGRLIKWKGRAASIAPAMLSVSLIALSSGMASGQTVISTALTTPQTISTDANVTVTSAGSVTLVNASDDAIIEIDVSDYTADVVLDGPLTFTSVFSADDAEGLWLNGDLSGTVTNNAAITVDIADDDDVNATGLLVSGTINEGASVANNGTISVTATVSNTGTDDDMSATAYGVDINDLDGQLANNGSIEVTATASGSATDGLFAYAYGINGDTVGTAGSIINDGSILVSATAEGTATDESVYASAYGILLDDLDGTISNAGSIDVTATARGTADDEVYSTAWGIYAGNSIGADGSITNDGTIKVTASSEGTSSDNDEVSATAYGIYYDNGDLHGKIVNNGSIEVTASATGSGTAGLSAYAYAIYGYDLAENAAFTNDGSIVVTATADGTATDDSIYASAYGVYIDDIDGTLSNEGSIEVTATASGSGTEGLSAYAYGINAREIGVDGSLTSSGSILVTATANGTATEESVYAVAYGIELDRIYGTVSNAGSIEVTATASGSGSDGLSAYAYGIEGGAVQDDGSISNTGSILVTATADGTATDESVFASAFGFELSEIYGTVSNAGSIEVTATASGSGTDGLSAFAYGIEGSAVQDGGLVSNTGSIIVTATADGTATDESLYASAYGVDLGGIYGTVSNAGSIEVAATASGSASNGLSASAYGIEASSVEVDGSLSNSGSILVTATSDGVSTDDTVEAYAAGVQLSQVDGMVSNAGLIVASATATGSASELEATAYGIRSYSVGSTGTVANTGTILVSAEAEDLEDAYGIWIDGLDGALHNSGTVLAFAENGGNATAIQVNGGSGSATFTTESLFAGRLSLTNAELTVQSVANTESIYWTFDDIPQSVTLDDEDGPKLFRDGNVIATVEPVNLAFSGQIAAEMANMGGGTVAALLAGAPSTVTTGMQNAEGAVAAPSGTRGTVFVEGDLVSRKLDDAAGRELDFDVSGVTAGFVGRAANGMGFGLTVSGVNSKGSTASGLGRDSIDTDGIVLGAYGNTALGAASLTFGVTVGMLSNNGTRSVNDNLSENGVSTVSADYDSSFVSPSVELSTVMQSGAATIRPYVGYRYTRLKIDGFTETGGPAAASFDSRDVDVSDFTIGADLSMPVGQGTLTGSAQILRRVVSDDGASFAVFGDTGHTASAATDFTALELGIGYSVEVGAGMLSIGASGMAGDNGLSGYGISASYRLAF
jgi:hypothetical protein